MVQWSRVKNLYFLCYHLLLLMKTSLTCQNCLSILYLMAVIGTVSPLVARCLVHRISYRDLTPEKYGLNSGTLPGQSENSHWQ